MSRWIPLLIIGGVIAALALWSLMWVVAASENPVQCKCEECEADRKRAADSK